MPATPSNLINTDLDIGGSFFATGNIGCSGDMASTGSVVASDSLALVTANLSSYRISAIETGVITLDTTSFLTGITLPAGSLPSGSVVVGGALLVVDEVVVDSTTMDLAVNPSLAPAVDVLVSFTKLVADPYAAGLSGGVPSNPGVTILSGVGPPTDADFCGIVFSGGATDTPSAGSVRVVLYVATVTPPLS